MRTLKRCIVFSAVGTLWVALAGFSFSGNPGDCRLPDDARFASVDGGCRDLGSDGLVWSSSYITNTGASLRQPGAISYCDSLVEGGYSDWRLPTRDELVTVAQRGAADYVAGNNTYGHHRWSSTTRGARYAYAVGLWNAVAIIATKTSAGDGQCVRLP